MKRLFILAVFLAGCSPLYTLQDYCRANYYMDASKEQACLDVNEQAKRNLHSKLIHYQVIDNSGQYDKSKEEYRIFNKCVQKYNPHYTRIDSCFDGWLLEWQRTGRWGINAPGW